MSYYFKDIEWNHNELKVTFVGTGAFYHGIMWIFKVIDNHLQLLQKLGEGFDDNV
jgi:hypothetical protein